MSLVLVHGVVTALRERTHVTADSQSVKTESTTEFRIDQRPANLAATCNLTIGDKVVAAGHDKPELEVLALRNDSTNVIYSLGVTSTWALGAMLLMPIGGCAWMFRGPEDAFVGGIFVLGGLFTFPIALWLLRKRSVIANARRMVDSAPRG